MEGPEEHSEAAQARLVKCMAQPFVRDRSALHQLKTQVYGNTSSSNGNNTAASLMSGKEGSNTAQGSGDASLVKALSVQALEAWDACYHCGMRLDLTVDSNVADTWYDAK